MNNIAYKSIDWRTPLVKSTGETLDISELFDYFFWDLIIYYDLPSEGENGEMARKSSKFAIGF